MRAGIAGVVMLVVGLAVGSHWATPAAAAVEDPSLALLCKRFEMTARRTRDFAANLARQDKGTRHAQRDEAVRDALNAIEWMVCVPSR